MSVWLDDIASDMTADSTGGKIKLPDWISDSYFILCSHLKNFTLVCIT
jgi:alkyl hydroperoxide reductase subunit AhpC